MKEGSKLRLVSGLCVSFSTDFGSVLVFYTLVKSKFGEKIDLKNLKGNDCDVARARSLLRQYYPQCHTITALESSTQFFYEEEN